MVFNHLRKTCEISCVQTEVLLVHFKAHQVSLRFPFPLFFTHRTDTRESLCVSYCTVSYSKSASISKLCFKLKADVLTGLHAGAGKTREVQSKLTLSPL